MTYPSIARVSAQIGICLVCFGAIPAFADSIYSADTVQRIVAGYEDSCPQSPCSFSVDGRDFAASVVALSPNGETGVMVDEMSDRGRSGRPPQFIVIKEKDGWRKIEESSGLGMTTIVTNGYFEIHGGKGNPQVFVWDGKQYVEKSSPPSKTP